MSNDEQEKVFKLGDDLIAVMRELVQLSFLTGTNIVDHMRAVQVEIDPETGKVVPTEAYIEAYERMITELDQQAQQAQQEHSVEQESTSSEDESVES